MVSVYIGIRRRKRTLLVSVKQLARGGDNLFISPAGALSSAVISR